MANPVTTAAANVAGAHQAAQSAAKLAPKRDPRPVSIKRPDDELLLQSGAIEPADAARGLAGNDQEEAREDRQEHPAYRSGPQTGEAPRLDLNA